MYIDNFNLIEIISSTIEGNQAIDGGFMRALSSKPSDEIVISGSIIKTNQANFGGFLHTSSTYNLNISSS